jgi:transposase
MSIIKKKVTPDSIVYTDNFKAYDALDVAEFKHYKVIIQIIADKCNHINGIENFWNQTKRHMRKFNDIDKNHFNLFLKECEWRFNIGDPRNLLRNLKMILKEFFKNLRCYVPNIFLL